MGVPEQYDTQVSDRCEHVNVEIVGTRWSLTHGVVCNAELKYEQAASEGEMLCTRDVLRAGDISKHSLRVVLNLKIGSPTRWHQVLVSWGFPLVLFVVSAFQVQVSALRINVQDQQ